MLIQNRNLKNS